jgi:hypothetical protein
MDYNHITERDFLENPGLFYELGFQFLFEDLQRTLDEFIIFQNNNLLLHSTTTENKLKFLDNMLKYFEDKQDYEKCDMTVKLKSILYES